MSHSLAQRVLRSRHTLVTHLVQHVTHRCAFPCERPHISALPEHPSPADVETHFRDLIAGADLEQPDEVEYDPLASELIFIWHESKVAIVIELGPDGPVDVRPGGAGFEPPV